jgi:glycosyltransferase domain-containing protein
MNKAQSLTIVILSRERQNFLLRQINYWKDYEFNVFIFDQSSEKLNNIIDSKRISYFHLDKNFQERVIEAGNLIKTKYVIYLPDDEFLIPSCLIDCIDYLDNNNEYFSCAGRSLEFEIKNRLPYYSLIYPHHKNFEITSKSGLERVLSLSNPYVFQPIHSVTKSIVWKTVSKIFSELDSWPPESFELFYGFTSAIYGNQKVLPQIMNLRSKENEPVNTIDWSQKELLKNKLYDLKFLPEISKLKNITSNLISIDFGITFMYGIHSYVNYINNMDLYKKNIKFLNIKILLVKIFNLFKLKVYKLDDILKNIYKENIKIDEIQLLKIDNTINDFHNM